MDSSIFLFRLFGFYFFILGFAYILKRDFFHEVYEDYFKNPALMAITSILTFVMGLLLVLNYNVWEFSAKGLVTLFGYLILFKGVSRIFFPYSGKKLASKVLVGNRPIIIGLVCILVGAWLLYNGYAV